MNPNRARGFTAKDARKEKQHRMFIDEAGGSTDEQWSLLATMAEISTAHKNQYTKSSVRSTYRRSGSKVFYSPHELSGWRFYWKALRYGDWRSIIYYLTTFFS